MDNFNYDYGNGIRIKDRDAVSFNHDPRPIVSGEMGAGTLLCQDCGASGYCYCDSPFSEEDDEILVSLGL